MKKLILALGLCLLFTGCKKEKKQIDVNYNNIGLDEISTNKDPVLKEGSIGNMFEIKLLKAQKINKDKINRKIKLDKNKSYLLLEYKIKDMRNDPRL